LADVEQVLLVDGPVQAEPRPDGRDLLGRRPFAEHGDSGIARDEVDEAEDEERDAEEDGDDREGPPNRVTPHRFPVLRQGLRATGSGPGSTVGRPEGWPRTPSPP